MMAIFQDDNVKIQTQIVKELEKSLSHMNRHLNSLRVCVCDVLEENLLSSGLLIIYEINAPFCKWYVSMQFQAYPQCVVVDVLH